MTRLSDRREDSPAPALAVGDITCRVLSDGGASYPVDALFAGIDQAVLGPELGDRLSTAGQVDSVYDCVLLETPTATVLMDTGLGRLAEIAGEPAGHLLRSLAAAGYSPGDIDVVLLSHAHPDHIGGLVQDGALTFQNAQHVMSATEWRYWTDPDSLSRMPEFMAAPARAMLPVLDRANCLELVEGEAEIVAGVRLVPAPGHTPGHCVVNVESAGTQLTLLADAILDTLQFSHLDWVSAFDHSAEQTTRTRSRLLHEAARTGSALLAYHIGSFGTVGVETDGYSWNLT
jgi:glyoxylase-like metal-dependent hydrolase (beta-lactamase superfamily II)